MVGVAEQGVDGGNATQAAVVPFREHDVFGAEDSATDAVQLVAVEHELVRVEREVPEDNHEDCEEEHGGCREKYRFLLQKVHGIQNKKMVAT